MEPIYLGNTNILQLPKTAFLCSSHISAEAVMKCYDWAMQQTEHGTCVISGFHSTLEKDVLHFLLKGRQPIVLVLGRKMYKHLPDALVKSLKDERLLIVSPVSQKTVRQSRPTALARNRYIIENADNIVFGCINEDSSLYPLYLKAIADGKNVNVL